MRSMVSVSFPDSVWALNNEFTWPVITRSARMHFRWPSCLKNAGAPGGRGSNQATERMPLSGLGLAAALLRLKMAPRTNLPKLVRTMVLFVALSNLANILFLYGFCGAPAVELAGHLKTACGTPPILC